MERLWGESYELAAALPCFKKILTCKISANIIKRENPGASPNQVERFFYVPFFKSAPSQSIKKLHTTFGGSNLCRLKYTEAWPCAQPDPGNAAQGEGVGVG